MCLFRETNLINFNKMFGINFLLQKLSLKANKFKYSTQFEFIISKLIRKVKIIVYLAQNFFIKIWV